MGVGFYVFIGIVVLIFVAILAFVLYAAFDASRPIDFSQDEAIVRWFAVKHNLTYEQAYWKLRHQYERQTSRAKPLW